MNTFPSDRLGVGMIGPIPVFVDARLTVRATLFDEHGNPLPHNQLTIPDSGMLPNFSANATVLYVRADDGTVRELFSNVARTMIPVNGSKGGNAALTSLMAALAQLGIVVDQTT